MCLLHHMQVLKLDVTSCLLQHTRTHTQLQPTLDLACFFFLLLLFTTRTSKATLRAAAVSRRSQRLCHGLHQIWLFFLFHVFLHLSLAFFFFFSFYFFFFSHLFCWFICSFTTGALFVHNCLPILFGMDLYIYKYI